MQARGFYGLLGVTAIVVVVALALSFTRSEPRVDSDIGKAVLPTVNERPSDIAVIAVKRDKGTVTLRRGQSGWTVAERNDYPADPGKVRAALVGLAELKLVEPKTRKADLYHRLEVEDVKEGAKSALLEVTDGSGQKMAELIVGKRRPDRLGTGADGIYIRRPGDAQSWLAQGSLDLTGEAKDWLDKKVVSIPPAKVKSVTIVHPDGSTLTIARDSADAKFAVADAPPDTKWKGETTIAEPAGALENLELNDVATAEAQPVPEDATTATFVTFDGLTVKAATWKKDETTWIRLDASGAGAEEITAKTGKWVYAVPAWKANPLKTKLSDLVEPAKSS
ncbi:MAG: DUF4340 domain-containing protein [Rhodospirillales bacterium]|nr:DUF4340 domain-containing protein [Rhodospirillales bacterium]